MGAILAIDQGTTGTTCLVFDDEVEVIGRAYREIGQSFPRPGWVEQDPEEIWRVSSAVAGEALERAGVRPGGLAGVGIANQRETVCAWDPHSGESLGPAIVWQDRRTAERCEELSRAGWEGLVRQRTGLVLDPYFSATKIQWMLEHVEGLAERVRRGRAVFGTVDSWLTFKLTGDHLTDASNASRTLLYDIVNGRWDPELLELFGVPGQSLPRVCSSSGPLASTRPGALAGHEVPVAGIAGDQQAALFGQTCLEVGLAKNTYGTGSFVLLNAGTRAPVPGPGLLGTIAWELAGQRTYALEASIFVTGAAVQWLRDGLGIIERAAQTEALAASLEGNEGVYFVPALTGLGSPHWDPHARGTIVGLTRGSGRAHVARAALEAMAYQTVDAVRAMEAACGERLSELRADGGATANEWLMQFQADVLGVPVVIPRIAETTALGAAVLAGIGVGIWSAAEVRRDSCKRVLADERARFEPAMGSGEREALLEGWAGAVEVTRNLGRGRA